MWCSQTLIPQQNGKALGSYMEEAVWPGSVFAAYQEALNLELVKLEGKGRNPSSVAGSAAHPGWVKLGSASHSVSQRDDEFSERSDAVL